MKPNLATPWFIIFFVVFIVVYSGLTVIKFFGEEAPDYGRCDLHKEMIETAIRCEENPNCPMYVSDYRKVVESERYIRENCDGPRDVREQAPIHD